VKRRVQCMHTMCTMVVGGHMASSDFGVFSRVRLGRFPTQATDLIKLGDVYVVKDVFRTLQQGRYRDVLGRAWVL